MSASVPIADQIAEVEREIGYRERVYPNWVDAGRLSHDKAALHFNRMRAAAATLRAVQRHADGLRALISYLGRVRGDAAAVVWDDHMPGAAEASALLEAPGVKELVAAFPDSTLTAIAPAPAAPPEPDLFAAAD